MAKLTGTKVITNKVRLSYANVLKPKAMQPGQKEKYSCTILIPKTDKETLDAIDKAITAAFQEDGGTKLKGIKRENVKTTLRDGDEKADTNPEYEGHMFMNVSSIQAPGILDKAKRKVTDLPNPEEEVYSGVYALASINFFAYNNNGNRGISAGLNNLLIVEKGERLAGRADAESDFEDFDFADDDDFEDLI